MKILRTVVFPIIWMLLALIIAIALIRMAFFSSAEATESESPTMNQLATTTVVSRGDIASQIEVSGKVERDPGVPVLAAQNGEVNHIWVSDGTPVLQGTRLFQIKVPQEETVEKPQSNTGEETEGNESTEEKTETTVSTVTKFKYYDVVAPADGTLAEFKLKVGSSVEKDGQVAEITAGTFSINADLTPEQQYQLLDLELQATASVAGLKDTITCVGAKVGEKQKANPDNQSSTAQTGSNEAPAAPASEAQVDAYGNPAVNPEPSLASLSCPMPKGTKTVPGLSATITIDTGSVTDVLTVPTTAVIGQITHGTVFTQDPATGEQQQVQVELGLQGDGLVEIKSGLEEGQEILEFAPGVDGTDPYGLSPAESEVVY